LLFQRKNDTFKFWKPGVWNCDKLTNAKVEQNFNNFIDEILSHSSLNKSDLTQRSSYPSAHRVRDNFLAETTSGSENDCLIHSVLTTCSPAFRLQNDNVKNNVASFFRRNILSQMLSFTLQERDTLRSQKFLDSAILTKIADCFKVSFCVFLTSDNTVQLINTLNKQDYYLISNDGGSKISGTHFEAVFKIVNNERTYKISNVEGEALGQQAYA
jgi:hypothetical protein